jgi:hypothetical protein
MNDVTVNGLEELDPASTARLPVRNTVLAQIEAALLAEKLSVADSQARRKGIDPYNQVVPRKDTWANNR